MKRGLKLGFGIGLVVLGLFASIIGVALVALVGADGSFRMPETDARSDGHALLFDAIYVRGDLPTEGNLATTLEIEAGGQEPLFIGVGPTPEVAEYLSGVEADRVVQMNWPGGVRTEPIPGTRTPEAPAEQDFWEASDSGTGPLSIEWTVTGGDWTIVVMNADGSADVEVTGSVTVTLPILGPVSIIVLVVGIAMILAGTLLIISGAKMPKTPAAAAGQPVPGATPPRPDPAGL